MKKIGIITGLWVVFHFFMAFLPSCMVCDDDPIVHRLQSLSAEAKRIEGIEQSGSYQQGYFLVSSYHSDEPGIRYDSLGIEVVNALEIALNTSSSPFNFGVNSAYACSPVEKYDHLDEVIITSSSDYNSAYPKGSNLMEIMSVRANMAAYGRVGYENLFFTFNFPPEEDKLHDIRIRYILNDGREVEATIRGLLIKK